MPLYGGLELDDIAEGVKQQESSGGTNATRRFEPGFLKRYLSKKLEPEFEALSAKHGRDAMATSYWPFQIMGRTAYELGFRGSPEELENPETNRQYFEKKFTKDYQRTQDIKKALLRYNGGGNPQYPDQVLQHIRRRIKAKQGGRP